MNIAQPAFPRTRKYYRRLREALQKDESGQPDWLNLFLDACMLAFAVIVLALIYGIGTVVGY